MQVAVAKQSVHNLIETLPNSLLLEVANFILFIKMRDEIGLYKREYQRKQCFFL